MKTLLLSILAFAALLTVPARAQTTTTGSFQLTVNDTSCTTANPCTLQLYRGAGPAGGASCPSLATAGAYTLMTLTATALTTTATATATQWTYLDPVTSVAPGTAYCYNATVTYIAGGGPSGSLGGLTATVPFPVPSAPSSLSATWIPGN